MEGVLIMYVVLYMQTVRIIYYGICEVGVETRLALAVLALTAGARRRLAVHRDLLALAAGCLHHTHSLAVACVGLVLVVPARIAGAHRRPAVLRDLLALAAR